MHSTYNFQYCCHCVSIEDESEMADANKIIDFARSIGAATRINCCPRDDPELVIQFPDRPPELYTEEAIRRTARQYREKMIENSKLDNATAEMMFQRRAHLGADHTAVQQSIADFVLSVQAITMSMNRALQHRRFCTDEQLTQRLDEYISDCEERIRNRYRCVFGTEIGQ